MNASQYERVLARLYALERREGLLAAEFADTAGSAEDVLRVLIQGFDEGEHLHGDPDGVVWMPRVDDAGEPVYPAAGDPAFVHEASDGRWVVVAWEPA